MSLIPCVYLASFEMKEKIGFGRGSPPNLIGLKMKLKEGVNISRIDHLFCNIVSDTFHLVTSILISNKVFLLLSDRYCNPEWGFRPVFEHCWRLKPLGHHGRLFTREYHNHFFPDPGDLNTLPHPDLSPNTKNYLFFPRSIPSPTPTR